MGPETAYSAPVIVYNPSDEPTVVTWGQIPYALAANAFVVLNGLDAPKVGPMRLPADYCSITRLALEDELATALRDHLLRTFDMVGIVAVDGVTEKDFEEAFVLAERRHTEWLRSTLVPVLQADVRAEQEAKDLGLKHVSPDKVVAARLKAQDWLT